MSKIVSVVCVCVLYAAASGHRSTSFDLNEEPVMGKRNLDEQLASVYERDLVNMELPVRKGLVRFAVDKPQLKRSALNTMNSNVAQGKSATGQFGSSGGSVTPFVVGGVHKRGESSRLREVCPSFSDWVTRTEAEDPYGNRVTVLEHVPINGTLVRQYFYETFCQAPDSTEDNPRPLSKSQHRECLAIDKGQWNSRCRQNYIWTYGKVLKDDGKIGWSVIAIRGSCSCGVSRKSHRADNYFDDLE